MISGLGLDQIKNGNNNKNANNNKNNNKNNKNNYFISHYKS